MKKLILSIETSCDETSMAILEGHKVLSIKTVSQIDMFKDYGGVIPELASRMHVDVISDVLKFVLKDSKTKHEDIDYIAFTQSPGLVNALQIGLLAAKTLKMLLNKPLIAIDHLEGHLLSPFIGEENISNKFPMIGSIISGGHTNLYYLKDETTYKLIGRTLDDAMGETYDKVGKLLSLPYPSGPIIDEMTTNKKSPIKFKKPKVDNLDFSFSGIKSQVYREVNKNGDIYKEDIINSLQEVVSEHYVEKISNAFTKYNIKDISISGGVSASPYLRNKIKNISGINNIYLPELKYCSDNAAMIGYAAYIKILNNKYEDASLDVDSSPRSNIV